MFTQRSSAIAGNCFPRRTSVIRCCFYPAQLESPHLSMDMFGGRRQGGDFSLSLHTLCKGLWKFLGFFSVLSFPKACRKTHHSKESPKEKVPALGHASSPDSQSPHRFDVRPLGHGYSQICLVAGSQFCNSHWDFLQPQILTPGRTEITYSRLTSVTLYHVRPAPEQSLQSPAFLGYIN